MHSSEVYSVELKVKSEKLIFGGWMSDDAGVHQVTKLLEQLNQGVRRWSALVKIAVASNLALSRPSAANQAR